MHATMERNDQVSAAKIDVKSQVARTLIEAMEKGDTPWQRPWQAQLCMRPTNPTTGNGYKGINRILLGLSGRTSNHWMTFQQASEKGWQVRKGEKGTMIVKVVEFDREKGGTAGSAVSPGSSGSSAGSSSGDGGGDQGRRSAEAESERDKGFALRRYFVFNAEQIDGMPKETEPAQEVTFRSVEKAEAIMVALKEKTGLMVIHGGDKACYVPSLDEIRLPPKRAFLTEYDLWATTLHEACHSTLHEKRLNRSDAIGKRWGDEAYALEELRAEIASAILASETGVSALTASPEQAAKHQEQHAAYLRSWVKAITKDPMAIFTAAKDAERMAEYLLALEKQHTAMAPHKEWIEEYENARRA